MRAARVGAALLVASAPLLLAGCGRAAVSAAHAGAPAGAGGFPLGISLSADAPVCVTAGAGRLCQIAVWYANGTGDDVTIDAGSTVFRDGSGARYSGSTAPGASELGIAAASRAELLWSLRLPLGAVPAQAVWVAADGTIATAGLTAEPPSASASPSPSPDPTTVPSTGGSGPASAPPTSTVATPSASPSAAPRPSTSPTRSATATPPPVGSIG